VKAKPVSLHPLSFDEAIEALIKTSPKAKKKPTGTKKHEKGR
jgi:hypothetical protein